MTHCNPYSTQKILSLIDLTKLNRPDTCDAIHALCQNASTPQGQVAAMCVYPEWITLTKQLTHHQIPIATVINFPSGEEPLDKSLADIDKAQQEGADEIDIVFPYTAFLKGHLPEVKNKLAAYRQACHSSKLKVILETGLLQKPSLITQASLIAIEQGADMIKTSTGKTPVGATPEAIEAMMDAILQHPSAEVGIKISGGVSDTDTAKQYLDQIAHRMGYDWIHPNHVRIGSSQLIHQLLQK